MAKHKDKRPVAERVAANLRAQIMAGDLPPGAQLGTNEELRTAHKTSNVSIQRALVILKGEGLLEGRKGSGVFVREEAPQIISPASYTQSSGPGEPYSWITEAAGRGQRGGNTILSVEEVAPPLRVAAALGTGPGDTAVLRTRLGLLDDEPAELVRSYYPAELARGTRLADKRKIPGGSPTLLSEMGFPPREQFDQVAARVATTEEYELLEIPGDVPVLEVFRVVVSDDQRPIEVTVLVKPGHLYKMGYRLQ